jgi:hypothetical protein
MAEARPELTPEDRIQLRNFLRLVDGMSRSRFIQAWKTQDQIVTFAGGDGGPDWPTYDVEDFRSFLTMFRQVALLNNESVYFNKVFGTVGKYASPELRENLPVLKKKLNDLLEGRVAIMGLGDASGQSLSVPQALDALVNGKYFHTNDEHRETVEFLDSEHPTYSMWPIVNTLIIPCLSGFVRLFRAIYQDGILPATDYPTPPTAAASLAEDAAPSGVGE